jgi:dihydrofolate synthase/folylpolyglutamate synthase
MTDAYRDGLDFLYGRLNYERVGMPGTPAELRLARMRRLLRQLGDPQRSVPVVHVAGTKGKGSTSAMLAAALGASGRRVGLFCSPHLHRLEERFRVEDRDATPSELLGLIEAVRPVVARLDAEESRRGRRGPTFFEVTTAMGLLHFARQGVDLAVIEVGMGGRLDSTNVVRPLVSVITSISLDHTRQLGGTTEAIATEKAGIIKRGRPVVSGVSEAAPRAAILRIARQRRSPIRELGPDFTFAHFPPDRPLTRPSGGTVGVRTWRRQWDPLRVPLLGPHQAHNAAVALATLDVLAEAGHEVTFAEVERGFARLSVPARVEVLGERPWLVIDGAHNVASAAALAATLRFCLPAGPRTLVFGTTRDKDLVGQLRELIPLFGPSIATRYVGNPRSVPPEDVAEAMERLTDRPSWIAADPAQALALARELTPREGLICVTGSMFLAAEARAVLLGLEAVPTAVSPSAR